MQGKHTAPATREDEWKIDTVKCLLCFSHVGQVVPGRAGPRTDLNPFVLAAFRGFPCRSSSLEVGFEWLSCVFASSSSGTARQECRWKEPIESKEMSPNPLCPLSGSK